MSHSSYAHIQLSLCLHALRNAIALWLRFLVLGGDFPSSLALDVSTFDKRQAIHSFVLSLRLLTALGPPLQLTGAYRIQGICIDLVGTQV